MKTDKIKEHIRSIVDNGHNEPKWERLVFGMGIGPKATCKTPAEAFVSRMYDYYCGGEKLVFGEEKAKEIFDEFCDNWQNDVGLNESEKKPLLSQALKIAKEKISHHMIEAASMNEKEQSWDETEYRENNEGLDISVAIAYTRIALTIENMMAKEKEKSLIEK